MNVVSAPQPPQKDFAQVDFCVGLAKPLTGAMDDHGGRTGFGVAGSGHGTVT